MSLNPLLIETVFEEIFKNLNNDITSLKTCRQVCKAWNNHISTTIIPSKWIVIIDRFYQAEEALLQFNSAIIFPDQFYFTSFRLNIIMPEGNGRQISSTYANCLERIFHNFASQMEELIITIRKGKLPITSRNKAEESFTNERFITPPLHCLKTLKIDFRHFSGLIDHMLASMLITIVDTALNLKTLEYQAYDNYTVAPTPGIRQLGDSLGIADQLGSRVSKSVKCLSWEGMRFNDKEVNSVFHSLGQIGLKLNSLKVSTNSGVLGIKKLLIQQSPTLKDFSTNLLNLNSDIPREEILQSIPPDLNFPNLRRLDIDCEGTVVLELLPNFPCLQKLTLGFFTEGQFDDRNIEKCLTLKELVLLAPIPRGYHSRAIVGPDLLKLLLDTFPNLETLSMVTDVRNDSILLQLFESKPPKLTSLYLPLVDLPRYSCPYSGPIPEITCLDAVLTGLPNQLCLVLKQNRFRHLDMCNNVERKPNLQWLQGLKELKLTTDYPLTDERHWNLTDITAHFCLTSMPALRHVQITSQIARVGQQYSQQLGEMFNLEIL